MALNSGSWFQDVFARQENDFVSAANRFVAAGSDEVCSRIFAGFIGRLQNKPPVHRIQTVVDSAC
jgi:hypothetical protein